MLGGMGILKLTPKWVSFTTKIGYLGPNYQYEGQTKSHLSHLLLGDLQGLEVVSDDPQLLLELDDLGLAEPLKKQ